MFDSTRHIAITGVDMRTFIRAVYELSEAKGFGQVMVRSGLLENEMVELILAGHRQRLLGGCNPVLHMDDVHGRKCSMMVYRDGDVLYIPRLWYGHSDEKLRTLLKRCGIRDTRSPERAFSTEHLGGVSREDDLISNGEME